MRHVTAAWLAMVAAPALAGTPAATRLADVPARNAADLRLPKIVDQSNPALRIDDPRSPLRSGYGGSMVDLFPVAGGKFRFSAGPRLFGRAGRPRATEPESLQLLPTSRLGPRPARRFTPALLAGYGRTVDQGLALGVDAGMVMGRIVATPDRMGRFNRQRLDRVVGRSRQEHANALARMTALYRF